MKRLFASLFLLLFLLIKPQLSFAEVIHSFDTEITANKTGVMTIKENISYDFENESKHGIYRTIPLYSSVGNLYRIIEILDVTVHMDSQNENYLVTHNSQNLTIRIGDPDKTISGSHIYSISYRVYNGIGSNFADHDEIYWNATGNDWKVNVERASAKVETDFEAKLNEFKCFEGSYGSKNQSCKVLNNVASSSQILYPGDGLTVVAVYPVGTFPKSILSKASPQSVSSSIFSFIFANFIYIFAGLNFILAPYLVFWYLRHKNKIIYRPAVNFDIPKDSQGQIIRPALAGTIDSAKLDKNDVVATIFDLAIRKYIKLEEANTVIKFFPDIKDQKIIKLKEADEELNSYEKVLLERLFKDGDSVKVSSLKKDFFITFIFMEKEVFNNLVAKNYYSKNPKAQKILLRIAAFLSLFSVNVILALVLFFLSLKFNGRTSLGDEVDSRIDGLKIFLKSMDRNYKWQAEQLYVVEEMIPYAMALGLIDKFMEQLKIIKPDYNPTWYSGTGGFYAGYTMFYTGVTSSMAPASSSGSSGGFSGGGGGGGGGGSW